MPRKEKKDTIKVEFDPAFAQTAVPVLAGIENDLKGRGFNAEAELLNIVRSAISSACIERLRGGR